MKPITVTKKVADEVGVDLERLEWLDAYLQRMIDEKKHPFESFRVWRKNTLVFSGDYGTQTPGGEPLRPDAIYPLASETKPVLATCAAILQEEGRVNFYDKVQDHFPEFTGENKDRVMLWHLLCHTSGVTDDEIEKYRSENPDEPWDTANFKAPLATLPGTSFYYWSQGYNVWKDLIERITGKTLEQYAREKIFDPLGMDDTHWVLPKEKYDRRVIRADGFKGTPWIDNESAMSSTSASGGLKSTMDDMAKFGLMYINGGKYNGKRIMSPASIKLLTRNHNEGVPESFWLGRWLGASWGLGWDVKCGKVDDHGFLRSDISYNHGGYGGATLLIDPEYDLVMSMYMAEQRDESVYDDMNAAIDITYGALD